MVFRGRSRACIACKKRRKNCDQTRPSCLRCIRSNRTCTGYEESPTWTIKQYPNSAAKPSTPFTSRARKCSLPIRSCVPGTKVLVADVDNRGTEISPDELLDLAIRAFFYDFCVIPSTSCGGRGYLAGLEPAINRLGSHSILGKACQAVTYITHGQVLQRPQLIQNAEHAYNEVVGRLSECIDGKFPAASKEIKWAAMLLGLYEISKPNLDGNDQHQIHAAGLGTLLGQGQAMPSLLHRLSPNGIPANENAKNSRQASVLFTMPQPDNPAENLEAILVSLDTLWSRYKSTPTVHDVEYLKIECQTLKERLAKWEDAQPQEAKPTTVAMLEPVFQTPCTPIGRWPGKVDTYPDLYIASVWNYARAARILLTSLMLTISTHLGHWGESHDTLTSNIKVDIQEILSSIPYHLAENLYDFLKEGETEISDPGKTLGGMLIMHPLYIASKAPFLPEETKNYLQRCLSWIASNMGIGQAEILAQYERVGESFIRSACMIMWAGYLG